MKNFNQKWRKCAAQAQKHPPATVSMPFGFAERVWRRRAQPGPEAVSFSSEGLWLRFGLRTLAGVSAVLIVFMIGHWTLASKAQLLRPPLEHSIVEYSGLL